MNKSKKKTSQGSSAELQKRLARLDRKVRALEKENPEPKWSHKSFRPEAASDPMRVNLQDESTMSPECQTLCKAMTGTSIEIPAPVIPTFTHAVGFDSSTGPLHNAATTHIGLTSAGTVVSGRKTVTVTCDVNGRFCLAGLTNYVGLQTQNLWYTDGTYALSTTDFATQYNTTATATSFPIAVPSIAIGVDPYSGDALNYGAQYGAKGCCVRYVISLVNNLDPATTREGHIYAGINDSVEYPLYTGATTPGTKTNVNDHPLFTDYDADFFATDEDIIVTGTATAFNFTYGALVTATNLSSTHTEYIAYWGIGLGAGTQLTFQIDAAYFAFGVRVNGSTIPRFVPVSVYLNSKFCLLSAQNGGASHQEGERSKVISKMRKENELKQLGSVPTFVTSLASSAGFLKNWNWRSIMSAVGSLIL